jgi:hypothetical protein
MSIIVKAKSLPKNLTEASIASMNLADANSNADPISTFASKIEKVTTRIEVDENINNLRDAREFGLFKLGGAIAVAQSLFKKKKSEFAGYKSFREYIEVVHGIPYWKAMHAARMYTALVDSGVPGSRFEDLGWTKARLILDVVTKDNVNTWVAKAKEMNFPSLEALVKMEKKKGNPQTEQGTSQLTITTKTFKLHDDQKQLVQDGLKKAQEETGSPVDAVNLEAVFQNYMGGGLAFSDWEQALIYAAKHTNDAAALVQKLVAMMKELFPQLGITVQIAFNESAPAA